MRRGGNCRHWEGESRESIGRRELKECEEKGTKEGRNEGRRIDESGAVCMVFLGRVMEQVHLRGLQGPRYIVVTDFNYRYWKPVRAVGLTTYVTVDTSLSGACVGLCIIVHIIIGPCVCQ